MRYTKHESYFKAQELYFSGHYTHREIAAKVSVAERTIRNWIANGAWNRLRETAYLAPAAIIDHLCSQLVEMQNGIACRKEGLRFPDAREAATTTKLINAIIRMKAFPADAVRLTATHMHPVDDCLPEDATHKFPEVKIAFSYAPFGIEGEFTTPSYHATSNMTCSEGLNAPDKSLLSNTPLPETYPHKKIVAESENLDKKPLQDIEFQHINDIFLAATESEKAAKLGNLPLPPELIARLKYAAINIPEPRHTHQVPSDCLTLLRNFTEAHFSQIIPPHDLLYGEGPSDFIFETRSDLPTNPGISNGNYWSGRGKVFDYQLEDDRYVSLPEWFELCARGYTFDTLEEI